jgi:cation:H+ antiporter
MTDFLILLAGLAVLLAGGDFLVRGAVGLAEKLNIPPLVIGLTIVAFGTSAPELFVSVKAALDGAGGIAIGNVVGSNIANILLVLSVPALIKATKCDEKGLGRNILVMIGMSVVCMGMLWQGTIGRTDGLILVVLLALFLYDQYVHARSHREAFAASHDYHEEVGSAPAAPGAIAALIAAGLIALPAGAHLTVQGATSIAQSFGISEEVIGLTVIALGTSLPELAASVMAVWRGTGSVALGNVIGSNIFNIAAILGISSLVAPLSAASRIAQVDMWVMLAAALLIAAFAHWRIDIGRAIGTAMASAYVLYAVLSYVV